MKYNTPLKQLGITKIGLVTALMLTSLTGFAQPKPTEPAAPAAPSKGSGTSDKVDLKKLEDKYWAAKDDEYGVIQNRTFSKAGKFYLSLVYGPLINDQFGKGRATGGMLGYYFSEDFGIEASYLGYDTKVNDTVENYRKLGTPANPDFNLLNANKTLSLTYTPFYAKMAFMNKAILYFDMGFTLGVGQTDYEIQRTSKNAVGADTADNVKKSAIHYEIGVMQQLFLSQYFAFRLDVKNTFSNQTMQNFKEVTAGDPRTESKKSVNDTTITLGLTVFTP